MIPEKREVHEVSRPVPQFAASRRFQDHGVGEGSQKETGGHLNCRTRAGSLEGPRQVQFSEHGCHAGSHVGSLVPFPT